MAPDELLPVVYDELRRLAAAKLAGNSPGQTLQATALVHEAFLRLGDAGQDWDSRGHFFAAAAEAMRRILVETARRKQRVKHGGGLSRRELVADAVPLPVPSEELLQVHEALDKLASANPQAAELVKLRYFAGFTVEETADMLGISPRTASFVWSYARAWLAAEIEPGDAVETSFS